MGDDKVVAMLREIRDGISELGDSLLTDDEAARFLRVSLTHFTQHQAEYIRRGAAVMTLPTEGEGKRPRRRWRRSSLLEMTRMMGDGKGMS